MGKHEVDDQEIKRFNWKRESLIGKEFTSTEIYEELKKLGYTKHNSFLKAMTSGANPPIIKPKRGIYCFNPKPVYKDRLQLVWDEYTKIANPKNYTTGKYQDVVSVETAIKILKDAGYRVLKPVTQYEEI